MIDAIAKMGTGEDHGIDTDDLKKSGFGKLVMVLYNHKQETPAIKKQLRKLIEEWSRTIFGKSGNMRDLASVQSVRIRKQGLTTYSRASMNADEEDQVESSSHGIRNSEDRDIGAVLSKGVKQARDLGRNRVRIPVSKGFQYSVRPSDVTGNVADKKTRISNDGDKRESLHKRMLEKSRPVSKNARSANISIEGRPTKG
jgi:transcription factor SPN1